MSSRVRGGRVPPGGGFALLLYGYGLAGPACPAFFYLGRSLSSDRCAVALAVVQEAQDYRQAEVGLVFMGFMAGKRQVEKLRLR